MPGADILHVFQLLDLISRVPFLSQIAYLLVEAPPLCSGNMGNSKPDIESVDEWHLGRDHAERRLSVQHRYTRGPIRLVSIIPNAVMLLGMMMVDAMPIVSLNDGCSSLSIC